MDFPIKVALAQAVPTLPEGPGWWFEPKFDRHRVVLRRADETVILYARSGRVVTPYWIDLALAGMALQPGTVLDGEAVIWREGRCWRGGVPGVRGPVGGRRRPPLGYGVLLATVQGEGLEAPGGTVR
ncbi:hypothetical protein ACWD9K_36955 [Streptomyces sp. 900116325]